MSVEYASMGMRGRGPVRPPTSGSQNRNALIADLKRREAIDRLLAGRNLPNVRRRQLEGEWYMLRGKIRPGQRR